MYCAEPAIGDRRIIWRTSSATHVDHLDLSAILAGRLGFPWRVSGAIRDARRPCALLARFSRTAEVSGSQILRTSQPTALKKHGVDFQEATTIFGDPFELTIPDPDHSEDEARSLSTGLSVGDRLLVVAYTERGSNIRIIHARVAAPKERKSYGKKAET